MAKKKDIELDPAKVPAMEPKRGPAPKQPRLSPAAADKILEKVDRLTKK
jgi:hypothetical protein